MKNLKKHLLIIHILILSLMSVACSSKAENIEKNNLDEIEINDSISNESQDPYLIKLDTIANQIINNDEESIQEILNEAYINYGDLVENIYFSDQAGKMLLSPPIQLPDDYDARQRSWYKKALEKELFQPAPYKDHSVDKNIQTIAKALYQGDQLIGIIGMDYVVEDSQLVDVSEPLDETNEEKTKLPLEKKEELKNYAIELSNVVENEDNIDMLKKYFDEEIKNSNKGIDTIYLANKNEIYLITPYVQLPDNYDPSVRRWYESAIKEKIYISETYIDVVSNKTIITVSTKVELENDTISVLGIDFVVDL